VIVLLHSGGLDSHVCFLMHPDWKPVYVAHGSENEEAELKALTDLQELDPRFRVVVLRAVTGAARHDGHIAHRNLLLLTTALAVFPMAEAVAFGALLGEGSGDKSRAFCRATERVWRLSEGRNVKLLRPLRHMTKARALRHGMALPGGRGLAVTTSCYHGTHCGRCQACFRLGIARYLCGLDAVPPKLPAETLGIQATLEATPVRRWPALALANVDVLRAYALARLRRNLAKPYIGAGPQSLGRHGADREREK
jgi:7-cyano-7-deazaguanine synthase in queuosine biosynthesis